MNDDDLLGVTVFDETRPLQYMRDCSLGLAMLGAQHAMSTHNTKSDPLWENGKPRQPEFKECIKKLQRDLMESDVDDSFSENQSTLCGVLQTELRHGLTVEGLAVRFNCSPEVLEGAKPAIEQLRIKAKDLIKTAPQAAQISFTPVSTGYLKNYNLQPGAGTTVQLRLISTEIVLTWAR